MNKKKLSMMVATVLMAVLVAGMGAMTYSKYITTTTTEKQQATAANWGFVVTADASELFGNAYNVSDESPNVATKVEASNNEVSVKANTTGLIVAPGTAGKMTITINGRAEVMAQLNISVVDASTSEICLKNYNEQKVDYYPIIWTLKDGSNNKIGESGTLTKVLSELKGKSQVIKPNEEYGKAYTLSWEWPLETGTGENTGVNNIKNIYDSIIGYKSFHKGYTIAKDTDNKIWNSIKSSVRDLKQAEFNDTNIITTVSFQLNISIEQIQEVPQNN